MGQKADDTVTIPLCRLHHQEQHRIGWKRFLESYGLDIVAILTLLNAKPKLFITAGRYYAEYLGTVLTLTLVEYGLTSAWIAAQDLCREFLIEGRFERLSWRMKLDA